jgi:hypothetical protein
MSQVRKVFGQQPRNVQEQAGTSRVTAGNTSASLAPDTRRLDDGPPLFNFGFVIGSQRLRSQLFTRRNLLTQISQSLPHCRIGQCRSLLRRAPIHGPRTGCRRRPCASASP